MKEQLIKIYKCSHCPRPKAYQRKSACERHELICSYNPVNKRACFNCKFLEMVVADRHFDANYTYASIKESVKVLRCNKLEMYVYPPKIEHIGQPYDNLDLPNEAMPKECEHREFGVNFSGFKK